mmetsp:Transcript_103515/g.183892  ORF Transcript_103515/g.183892 Transcript_103515/m.183892 type:complete len:554 (-) Transcript_103515:30-1691(-)
MAMMQGSIGSDTCTETMPTLVSIADAMMMDFDRNKPALLQLAIEQETQANERFQKLMAVEQQAPNCGYTKECDPEMPASKPHENIKMGSPHTSEGERSSTQAPEDARSPTEASEDERSSTKASEDARSPMKSTSEDEGSPTIGSLAWRLRSERQASEVPEATVWPAHYKEIERIGCSEWKELVNVLKPYVDDPHPVIVRGYDFVDVKKWGDTSFLKEALKDKAVFVKKSDNGYFRFFKEERSDAEAKRHFGFEEPVRHTHKRFEEFLAEAEELQAKGSYKRMYMQEGLEQHSQLGVDRLMLGMWHVSCANSWGMPERSNLYVGMQECISPLHYDESENLYFQVRNHKEVCLFPWVQRPLLYPFPCAHPCDRQSMIGDPRFPDLDRFPGFQKAVGYYAVLKPGDLLYIPYGWWHWFRNIDHLTISIATWSLASQESPDKIVRHGWSRPLIMRLMRNLESQVIDKFGVEGFNARFVKLREAMKKKDESDETLQAIRQLLVCVDLSREKQDEVIMAMTDGRFGGVRWQRYVNGNGGTSDPRNTPTLERRGLPSSLL